MLLFIDESGHNNSGTPCEVLAGVAIAEDNLWNLVCAVRSAERDHFGDYLRDVYGGKYEPIRAMALRDVYELMEKVVDRCHDAGNVVMYIVLKNS